MKLNLIVIFLCTFISSAWANTADDFEQYKNKRQAELASYISKQHQEFAAYKLKIKEKWGYEEPNTKTQMVVYSDDLNQKVVVDYKTREIRVSLTPQTAQDDSTIQRVLLKLLTTPVQALVEQSQRESTGFTGQSESSKQQTLAESLGINPADFKLLGNEIIKSKTVSSKHDDPRYKKIITRKVSINVDKEFVDK